MNEDQRHVGRYFLVGKTIANRDIEIELAKRTGSHQAFDLRIGNKQFSGQEIEANELPIGSLITVTELPSDRAGRARRFSILLPQFGTNGTHEFTTHAIETIDSEFAVHRPVGAITTYTTIELKGKASVEGVVTREEIVDAPA